MPDRSRFCYLAIKDREQERKNAVVSKKKRFGPDKILSNEGRLCRYFMAEMEIWLAKRRWRSERLVCQRIHVVGPTEVVPRSGESGHVRRAAGRLTLREVAGVAGRDSGQPYFNSMPSTACAHTLSIFTGTQQHDVVAFNRTKLAAYPMNRNRMVETC